MNRTNGAKNAGPAGSPREGTGRGVVERVAGVEAMDDQHWTVTIGGLRYVTDDPDIRDQLQVGWLSSFRWERIGRRHVITSATLQPANVLNPERELRDVPMTFHEVMARRWAKEVALQRYARARGIRLGEDEDPEPGDGERCPGRRTAAVRAVVAWQGRRGPRVGPWGRDEAESLKSWQGRRGRDGRGGDRTRGPSRRWLGHGRKRRVAGDGRRLASWGGWGGWRG